MCVSVPPATGEEQAPIGAAALGEGFAGALAPCPFCGGEARIGGTDERGFYVACIGTHETDPECYAVLNAGHASWYPYDTPADAAAAWSRRTAAPVPATGMETSDNE